MLPKFILIALALSCAAANLAYSAEQDAETTRLEDVELVAEVLNGSKDEPKPLVAIIDKERILASGHIFLNELLHDLAISGATQNAAFNNGGNGETSVDLRNLGANRTLVLVNGRRWITTLNNNVDLGTIPLHAVERIEILKDGASALYGSDAIGGVVNIVLAEHFDGAEANAYIGGFSVGDGRVEAYDWRLGVGKEDAGLMLGVAHTKQEPVWAGDRAISAVPTYGIRGTNPSGRGSAITPYGRYVLDRPRPDGSRFTDLSLIPGRSGTSAADFKPWDVTEGYNYAPENYLLTPREQSSVYARGDYALGEWARLDVITLFNQRRSRQRLAPMPLELGLVNPNPLSYAGGIYIPREHPYNPFGIDVYGLSFRDSVAPRSFEQDVDTFHFGAELSGAFDLWARGWNWDTGAQFTDNEENATAFGVFDLERLDRGLGVGFVDAQGIARCGTAVAPVPDCVPINLFGGPEGFTRTMYDSISFNAQDAIYKRAIDYSANLTSTLYELPAGPLAFAAGYEYRTEFAYDRQDSLVASGTSTSDARSPVQGGDRLHENYVEFNIPLLKDEALAKSLEVSLAARYSAYANFPRNISPKMGLRWKPFEDLLLHGNYAEGFRAPSVNEQYLSGARQSNAPLSEDPCTFAVFIVDEEALDAPYREIIARCRNGFEGVTPSSPRLYNVRRVPVTIVGNERLAAETATNRSLGLIYEPHWLAGLRLGLDWYRIRIFNTIAMQTPDDVLYDCYVRASPFSCQSVARYAQGQNQGFIENIDVRFDNNLLGTEAEGFDFAADYDFDTKAGRFLLSWDNAYVAYYGNLRDAVEQPRLLMPQPFGNEAGTYFDRYPNWRLKSTIGAQWRRGNWSAALQGRYLSGLDENCIDIVMSARAGMYRDQPEAERLCSKPEGSPQFPFGENHLDAVWYWNAQAAWATPWNGKITAGVHNLFDRDPPVSYSTWANSFDPQYEIPGRFWYVAYSQRF